jgi:hypothetical protein
MKSGNNFLGLAGYCALPSGGHVHSGIRERVSTLDTLYAGEARLLQMIDDDVGLQVDITITGPDLCVVPATDGDTLTDDSGYDSVGVSILATFYNMGTSSSSNVRVYLEDLTTDEVIKEIPPAVTVEDHPHRIRETPGTCRCFLRTR